MPRPDGTGSDLPRCCLVTDRRQARRGLVQVVREAIAGGVRFIQVREKDLPARELQSLVAEIVEAARGVGALVVVNDRIDVAQAAGASGVHLGGASLRPEVARRLLGPEAWIGVSTHEVAEVLEAERGGANYVSFGPIFRTPSKEGILEPRGPGLLTEVRRSTDLPVLALGGIRPDRVESVLQAGASGISVVSHVMASDDPRRAARELVEAVDRVRRETARPEGRGLDGRKGESECSNRTES